MRYERKTKAEKIRIVKLVTDGGLSIAEVSRRKGVDDSTLQKWVTDRRYNQNEEYVKLHAEKVSRRKIARNPKDPFPEGVVVAARTNPDELAKENKDLRKKIAFLEDKVAYMEALYSILKEDPTKVAKKTFRGHQETRPAGMDKRKEALFDRGGLPEVLLCLCEGAF